MIIRASMLFTFSKAVARTARALLSNLWKKQPEPVVVDKAVHDEREKTCRTECPHLHGEQCKICACFIDAKTWLSTETCPDERWKR